MSNALLFAALSVQTASLPATGAATLTVTPISDAQAPAQTPVKTPADAPGNAPLQTSQSDGDLQFLPAFFADARPVTALDMVRRVPGFVIEGTSMVRGFSNAGGNVIIDGARPSTKNLYLEDLLKAIPADQVAMIELIRTPRAGLDQQGTQMLVNVIRTKTGSAATSVTLANYAYTQRAGLPSVRVETNRRTDKGGWDAMLYIARNQDEGGKGRRYTTDGAGGLIDDAAITVDAPLHGLESRLSGDRALFAGTLRGNLSYTYQDYSMREDAQHENGLWAGTLSRVDDGIITQNAEASAEWSGPLLPGTQAKFMALGTRKTLTLDSASEASSGATLYEGHSRADERILSASLSGSLPQGRNWELTSEFAYNTLASRSAFSMDGTPIDIANANIELSELRGEFGAQLSTPLAKSITAELDLKGEISQIRHWDRDTGDRRSNNFRYFKPKLQLRWDIAANHQLKLRAEREIGQLDFTDFASSASLVDGTVQAGNADLRPQTAWIFDAGIESRLVADAVISFGYRRHEIDNVLDQIVIGESNAPGNIGAGSIDAIITQLTLPLAPLGITGGRIVFSGEWRDSKVQDPLDGSLRAISGLAPFEGSIIATLDRPELNSTFGIDVYFGQTYRYLRSNEYRETSAQPYVTAKWTYTLSPSTTLDFALQNILGRKQRREVITYQSLRNEDEVQATENRWFKSTRGIFASIRKTI